MFECVYSLYVFPFVGKGPCDRLIPLPKSPNERVQVQES
jgi:hypothetical protein